MRIREEKTFQALYKLADHPTARKVYLKHYAAWVKQGRKKAQ
ncbi:hypothetical protein [Paenibacillus agaridevorans]|nr:hypothetical protein [Paenibacillus agaridevorans]